jgi:hypothetical protein
VALNVAVLGLNVQAEGLEVERDKLAAQRDNLEAELSRAAASGRIEAMAAGRFGLAEPLAISYVRLARVKE